MKITVIHHSADYDGIFCREIARKFLPDAEIIGWDFSDAPISIERVANADAVYILDLPVDRVFGFSFLGGNALIDEKSIFESIRNRIIWIDHHKSSIDTHPVEIPGYRIDGVAACRLAWAWFQHHRNWLPDAARVNDELPAKQDFIDRKVDEPYAVRLAGEYDIWEHKLSGGDDIAFQFGLDCGSIDWDELLQGPEHTADAYRIINHGKIAMACYKKRDADVMRSRSFTVQWEGLKFLALNTARCNSNTFAALDVPETGHDALMAFAFSGNGWNFSLYHAAHRKDIDLSVIATKHGGGGHRGACGFRVDKLPLSISEPCSPC